jgi:hypothetical protein
MSGEGIAAGEGEIASGIAATHMPQVGRENGVSETFNQPGLVGNRRIPRKGSAPRPSDRAAAAGHPGHGVGADPAGAGRTPSAGRALLQLTLLLVNIAAGLVGVVAITNLALRPGTSVGEALRTGLRRFPPLFVASLMIGLGFVLIAFVVILLFAGAAMEGAVPPDPRNLPPSFSVVILLLTVLGLALWIRS